MGSASEPARPRSFSLASAIVAVAAVVAAALLVADPSEIQTRLQTLVSTYAGVSLSETVDCSVAQQYLTDAVAVKGFHVLCVTKVQEGGKST
jgi:prolyl 4-hydroxylase